MQVTVIMSDAEYQRIIAAAGKKVRGSMSMNSPKEFVFNAFAPNPPRTPKPNRVLNMKHGKATIAPDRMRLYIMVKQEEASNPVQVVLSETDQAIDFFTNVN